MLSGVDLLGEKLCFAEYLEMLYGAFSTAFTRPAITPLKVNRFGRDLESCQPNVADFGRDPRSNHSEGPEKSFFGQVNNACFHRFPVG